MAEYDSYENRVEDNSNVVPMSRCLEKADILELLDATEGDIQWQMVRAPGPAPVAGDVAAALAAQEGSERKEEESDRKEESDREEDDIGLEEEEEDNIYAKLSNEHVTAMLISYLGPIYVVFDAI